jgi:hypothetical protein
MFKVLLLISFVFNFASFSNFSEQTVMTNNIPDDWKVVPTPIKEQRECANHSQEERKVTLENGMVKISKYEYLANEQLAKLPSELADYIKNDRKLRPAIKGYLHVEAFENGWLIGSDAGEWSGKLLWFNQDGTKRIEILNDNIRGIAKVGNEILILSGMAHLGTDKGKIYKLTKDFKANLLTDLQTQPQSFVIENNDSMIVTLKDKIIRVNGLGEVTKMIEVDFQYLYPNSSVINADGEIYIGMRMFVVKIKSAENGFVQEWLLPTNCQKLVRKDFGCSCK